MFKGLFQDFKNDLKAIAQSSYTKTAIVLASAGAMIAEAHAEVTLPTTGVNVGEYITAGITAVAAVIGIAVGGYIAFLIVKKALRWAGRAMG